MKRILPAILFLSLFISLAWPFPSKAQIVPPYGGGLSTKAQGSVGEYYLSVSGYSSPNSAISLIIDGVVIRSTISDQAGNFSISQVLIKLGLSEICFKALDYAQIGSSQSCLTIPAANSSVDIKEIFLAPILALSKNEISVGDSVTAYGYTMPGSLVTLYIVDGQTLTATADSKGYFEFKINGLKEGKYNIYAKAKYNNIDSLSPTKNLTVSVLTKTQQVVKQTGNTITNVKKGLFDILTSWNLGLLWIAIAIIILIIILLFKLRGGKFSSIFKLKIPHFSFVFPFAFGRKHPLHHAWFIGF